MTSLQLASTSSHSCLRPPLGFRSSPALQGGLLGPLHLHSRNSHRNALDVQNGELKSSVRVYRMHVLVASPKSFVPVKTWITTETRAASSTRDVSCGALPIAATAAITVGIVGAAAFALVKLQKEKPDVIPTKKDCGSCGGSGLCPSCKGEGFLLRNLTPEAAARARARAEDVATRYTAGLAKKWSYCAGCSGSRSCLACQGKGFLQEP